MNLSIISWMESGRYIYSLLKDKYEFKYVVEENPEYWGVDACTPEITVVSIGKAFELYQKGKINKFLIPCLRSKNAYTSIYLPLLERGVKSEDVLYAPFRIFRDKTLTDTEKSDLICRYEDSTDLELLVLHIVDHCNLCCAHCSMFSGLVKSPAFADYDKTERAVLQLKMFFDQIMVFRLIGGEPLLNKDIGRYCKMIRRIYPLALIEIVTNALLIISLSDEIISILQENDITLDITLYPLMASKIDEINEFLNEKKIRHYITQERDSFLTLHDISGSANAKKNFENCSFKFNCVNMKENHIAGCFAPFAFPRVNSYFDLGINVTGAINLFSPGLSAKKLKAAMNQPHNLCKYCHIDDTEKWRELLPNEIYDKKSWSI